MINECKDFYKVVRLGEVPQHDVVVTNPPYSGNHKLQFFEYTLSHRPARPWMALLPAYCATKNYFQNTVGTNRPFFVVPSQIYDFSHPEGTGHDKSPFHSVWFVGAKSEELTSKLFDKCRAVFDRRGARLYRDVAALVRAGIVRSEKRGNPRQRRKRRKLKRM